jgi:hypothetical protein
VAVGSFVFGAAAIDLFTERLLGFEAAVGSLRFGGGSMPRRDELQY